MECNLRAFWDAYHAKLISKRAAYTISDAISRDQSDTIRNQDLVGYASVHSYLLRGKHPSRLRVTAFHWDPVEEEYNVIWSQTPNAEFPGHTNETLNARADQIPNLADGDLVFLVEAQVGYTPILSVGLGQMAFEEFIVTRVRTGPQLVWENADGTTIGFGDT